MPRKPRAARQVNIHEAKTGLSKLVARAEAGEEIVIARGGRPVARLIAFRPPRARRQLGRLDGRFRIPDDFNRPLPATLVRAFEGRRR